jgi:hypothetical protein
MVAQIEVQFAILQKQMSSSGCVNLNDSNSTP